MKKRNLVIVLFIAIVLLIGGVVSALYYGGKSAKQAEQEKLIELTDPIVLYVDIDKLVTKSAINEVFTESNRALIATAIAGEVGKPDSADYISELMANLDNSGLNTKQPIYGYGNPNSDGIDNMTILADVADVDKLDSFVEFMIEPYDSEHGIVREGDMRSVEVDEFKMCYDTNRFICVVGDDVDDVVMNDALNRGNANLSAYAKYDVACSVRLKPTLEVVRDNEQSIIDGYAAELAVCTNEWERIWLEDCLATSQSNIDKITNIYDMLSEDAMAVMGISFEAGKLALEVAVNGLDSEFEFDRKVNNSYLDYVGDDVLAVMDLGVNGQVVSKMLEGVLTTDIADMFGISHNEYNIYVGILCDAIKSIDGDVALALNDVSGNYYGVNSVEALLTMDVSDNYIISNVAMFGEGILKKRDNNVYSTKLGGFNLSVGQPENRLFVAVNMDYAKSDTPASMARWAADIEDSYAYMLFDVDNIMDNSYASTLYRNAMRGVEKQYAPYVDGLIESCSHIYVNVNTPNSIEFALVFDDKQTNALEQVVRAIAPIAVGETIQNVLR